MFLYRLYRCQVFSTKTNFANLSIKVLFLTLLFMDWSNVTCRSYKVNFLKLSRTTSYFFTLQVQPFSAATIRLETPVQSVLFLSNSPDDEKPQTLIREIRNSEFRCPKHIFPVREFLSRCPDQRKPVPIFSGTRRHWCEEYLLKKMLKIKLLIGCRVWLKKHFD